MDETTKPLRIVPPPRLEGDEGSPWVQSDATDAGKRNDFLADCIENTRRTDELRYENARRMAEEMEARRKPKRHLGPIHQMTREEQSVERRKPATPKTNGTAPAEDNGKTEHVAEIHAAEEAGQIGLPEVTAAPVVEGIEPAVELADDEAHWRQGLLSKVDSWVQDMRRVKTQRVHMEEVVEYLFSPVGTLEINAQNNVIRAAQKWSKAWWALEDAEGGGAKGQEWTGCYDRHDEAEKALFSACDHLEQLKQPIAAPATTDPPTAPTPETPTAAVSEPVAPVPVAATGAEHEDDLTRHVETLEPDYMHAPTWRRLTISLRRAIYLSEQEARRRGSDMVDLDHLLLGIVTESRHGREYLGRYGLTEEIASHHLPRRRKSHGRPIGLSQRSAQAFTRAAIEAKDDNPIRTDHLLVGLLSMRGTDACRLLHNYGVTMESIRQEVADA
jgi:hypothetical protein